MSTAHSAKSPQVPYLLNGKITLNRDRLPLLNDELVWSACIYGIALIGDVNDLATLVRTGSNMQKLVFVGRTPELLSIMLFWSHFALFH